MTSLRKDWFEHVRKTRKKMSRGQKDLVDHRAAMKQASQSWPKEKEKILKRRKRDAKKQEKVDAPKKPKSVKLSDEKNIKKTQ